jgi:hypothetical protein
MDSKQFLSHVKQEIARLEKIRALLEASDTDKAVSAPVGSRVGKPAHKTPAKKQSTIKAYWARMTPEERTSEMNRRLKVAAKRKAAEAGAPKKAALKPAKKSLPAHGMSKAGREAVAAAQRKRRAEAKAVKKPAKKTTPKQARVDTAPPAEVSA